MPGETKIEWATHSWNPVTGCTKVSAGCDHCYAATFAERWRGIPGHPYEQGFDLKLWPERLALPIRWTKPREIFVNSMSDLFHADVPEDFIWQVFAAMSSAQQHRFMVLTKRPQRMKRILTREDWYPRLMAGAADVARIMGIADIETTDHLTWPLPNVWLGTSVENQEAAYRIDWLVKTPAVVRFLSCEPLLGPLDLSDWLWSEYVASDFGNTAIEPREAINWIITGGESGPGYRPLNLDWVRSIRDQCQGAGVAFFHKQNGGIRSKAGGRELDGREWSEMPQVAS